MKVSIAQVGWESDINERLSELVDEAVAKHALPKITKRCVQRCMTWELYATEQDREILGDVSVPWFECAKTVCRKIGLTIPSETTRWRILEALLLANNLPEARFFYFSTLALSQFLFL